MQRPKMGGNETLRLFLKGNGDLTASLLSQAEGGRYAISGLKELIHEEYGDAFTLHIDHEPYFRSDLLLQQLNDFPMPDWPSDLVDDGLEAQSKTELLNAEADVIVLSLQPDIMNTLWRHQDGMLFNPPSDWEQSWAPPQRDWFQTHFSPIGQLSTDAIKKVLLELVRRLKAQDLHIILYGCSSFDPDDCVYNYHGLDNDPLAKRINQVNLAFMEISAKEGISFIDVDRLIAEMGAKEHVIRVMEYSTAANQEIGREFFRVIKNIGFFEKRPLLMQVGERRG